MFFALLSHKLENDYSNNKGTKTMLTRHLVMTSAIAFAVLSQATADEAPRITPISDETTEHKPLKSPDDVLNAIHSANLKVVDCAMIALQRTENPEVKAYAEAMKADHLAADEEVKKLAVREQVELDEPADARDEDADNAKLDKNPGDSNDDATVPSTQGVDKDTDGDKNTRETGGEGKARHHKEAMTRLLSLTGAEFDREYMAMMVKGHNKLIGKLTESKEHINDEDVRGYVVTLLPALEKHRNHATALAEKVGAPTIYTETKELPTES